MLNDLLHPLLGLHGTTAFLLVAALCFAECGLFIGFFIPGETAVVLGGVLAYEHHVALLLMLLVVVVAAIAGECLGYLLGRTLGRRLVATRLLRNHPGVAAADALLRRRGARAVFLARFIAVLRALVPAVAGISGLRFRRFFLANVLGGLIWGVGFTLLGYGAGASYEEVVHVAGRASAIVVAVLALLAVVALVIRRHRAHRGATPPASDEDVEDVADVADVSDAPSEPESRLT